MMVRGVDGLLEKAAIIMLALDEERSQRLFAELDEDAIRRVSHAMARLGRMPMELIEQTVGEFREEVGRTGNVLAQPKGTERITAAHYAARKGRRDHGRHQRV